MTKALCNAQCHLCRWERAGFCLSGRLADLLSPGEKLARSSSERGVGLTAWRGPVQAEEVIDLTGGIREKRISFVNALADSDSILSVELGTAHCRASAASYLLLIIVPNANACWKAARSTVRMSIGHSLVVEFDRGASSDRKDSVNTHVNPQCDSQFVVAFAQHQKWACSRVRTARRVVGARATPKRGLRAIFQCTDSNRFARQMTTTRWSRRACYCFIESCATAIYDSVFPDTEDCYAARSASL
jgi:hypothetical protein